MVQVLNMALGKCFCGVVICLLLTDGIRGTRIYKPGESNMKKQFKHLNKAPVKTIKTEYGDIYDCIDFYKQPAFDHPALKNHNFHPHMRPSFRRTEATANNLTRNAEKSSNCGLKDGGCPLGTVPIRRLSDDDMHQAQILSMNHYASTIHPRTMRPEPGTHYAIVQTKATPGITTYYGVKSNLSTFNPTTASSQYSSGFVTMQDGVESIQAGWTVNPGLYKDSQTRMFIYTNAGHVHCFNTFCPGFVLVKGDIPLDMVLSYSTPGGPIHAYGFSIYQDPTNGNWWLTFNNCNDESQVGFWPNQLFSGLRAGGSYAACGGTTYSKPGELDPPMGSGSYVVGDPKYDAYCGNFGVVNKEYKFVNVHTETFSDSDAYHVKDEGHRGSYEHLVYYGGPGGRPSS